MKRIILGMVLAGSVAAAWGEGLTIENASFEVDPVEVFPTYRTSITSWTLTGAGNYGVNTTAGPFMDNGAIPDGTKVLFFQHDVAASQAVSGFEENTNYTVRLFVNARAGSPATPQLRVSIDSLVLVPPTPVTPVGGSNPFREISHSFEATTSGTKVLKIENANAVGDQSLLVDKVEIFETPTSAEGWRLLE